MNNSLVRRIGTLNCGHSASPIILGVSSPQYTPEELEEMRAKNAEGVTVEGKHYTSYDATQKQRQFERAIRKQKNRILVDERLNDTEQLSIDQIRLGRLQDAYKEFNAAANLRDKFDRAAVTGFDTRHAKAAKSTYQQEKKQMQANPRLAQNGLTKYKGNGIIHSGATTGAYDNRNDPEGEKRNKHAQNYYESMRNSNKSDIVHVIAENTGITEENVLKMYNHLLVDKHTINGELKTFDPDYDIAESIRRLREGKDIQEHDKLLIEHEVREYDLMNEDRLEYERAHEIANESYNYKAALDKWLEKQGE
jgi:hypothetical protein